MSEQKIKCCAKVYPAGMNFPLPRPCTRNSSIEREGKWYCGSHDPVKKAERDKASQQKWEKRHAERMTDWRLKSAATELLEALELVLPYAISAIGLPRNSWPTDSVILKAEYAIKKARGES